MLDIKIVGGRIIDGTGEPAFAGEVGIKDGRIVAIGQVTEEARDTIDAAGQVVAPGFVDVHTHYDAQIFWDPALSPSCYHGVTTVVGGFCGFSIAPLTKDSVTYIRPMLARVEGMPLSTLEQAVPWDWSSFGDFLDRLENGIGLNAGFFCGHSAIRRIVMGSRAVGDEATGEEVDQMKALLSKSLAEGAMGFSTTISPSHSDADGNPVPSRWASRNELIELASVVADHEGTGLELLPDPDFGPGIAELMTDFSLAGRRAVNWNVLAVTGTSKSELDRLERQLAASDFARSKGAEVVALAAPSSPVLFVNLYNGAVFDLNPGLWGGIFKLPIKMRIAAFSDPETRTRLAQDAAAGTQSTRATSPFGRLAEYGVVDVKTPDNKHYQGKKIGEIAEAEGKEPIDVLCEIAIADGLLTSFSAPMGGHDRESYELRGKIWRDDRTVIGASDAGAHVDMIDTFAFSTMVLEKGVREHRVLGLEEAVHQMTEIPARLMGLVERGLLKSGWHADIVIFDPNTVARGDVYSRQDVPGGEFRLYADAEGIGHVIVNGVPVVRDGVHTGAMPGTVLRSGRDTRTVGIPADKREPQG